ncbi:unnamed protein product, partial [Laminaria digitata]
RTSRRRGDRDGFLQSFPPSVRSRRVAKVLRRCRKSPGLDCMRGRIVFVGLTAERAKRKGGTDGLRGAYEIVSVTRATMMRASHDFETESLQDTKSLQHTQFLHHTSLFEVVFLHAVLVRGMIEFLYLGLSPPHRTHP